MKYIFLNTLLVLLVKFSFGQEFPLKIAESDFSIGKSIQISSTILNENRDLNIYLPSSYNQYGSKTYPVIYLLDGSKDEDFIHIAGIVQFGSFSWIKMIPESIVVGIGNIDRRRDFTYPSSNRLDQKEFPTSGKSEKFISFIEKELQPFIEATYRTTETKTLIGQSLGGLLATEILLKKPELFHNYIIVSPSLWWDNENLLEIDPTSFTSHKSVYIAVGKEGHVMERTAKELFEKLDKAKRQNMSLHYEYFDSRSHGDALHNAVYNAFEKIFSVKG
ncbi:MAG: alpha/beta hydrolase [Bacteroidia bacterium]